MAGYARSGDDSHGALERVLGRRDLILLFIVAVANLNIVPAIASSGFATFPLWFLAIGMYFWPQGVAVIELSERWPNEGGIYLWAKRSFGDGHGFLAGWCYWLSSVVYLPTVLLSAIGVAVFSFGPRAQALSDNLKFTSGIALVLLLLLLLINVVGVSFGKWINNLGGYATAATVFVVCGLATLSGLHHQSAFTHYAIHQFVPRDWRLLPVFGVICYSLQGLDIASIMGDEINEPRRILPGAIFWGGLLSAATYLLVSAAMMVALPAEQIGVVGGVLQAINAMAMHVGATRLVAPLAALEALAILGSACAWFAGTARLPFVAGIDRYLPPALGKVHPRFHTPYVALGLFAVLSGSLIALSFLGATVAEAYVTMLDVAVILQMVPNAYLFLSLRKIAASHATPLRYGRRSASINAWLGIVATGLGIVLAFVPTVQIQNLWLYEGKLIGACLLVFGAAYLCYRRSLRLTGTP